MGDPRWTNGIDTTTLKVGDQFGIWPGWDKGSPKDNTGQFAPDYTWYNAMLGQIEQDYATETGQAVDGKITDEAELAAMRTALSDLDTGGKASKASDGMVTRDEAINYDVDTTPRSAQHVGLSAYADISCGSSLDYYGFEEKPLYNRGWLASGVPFKDVCYANSFALTAMNAIEEMYAQKTGQPADGRITDEAERKFFYETFKEMDAQCAYTNTEWLVGDRMGTRNDGILTADEFSLQVVPLPVEQGHH